MSDKKKILAGAVRKILNEEEFRLTKDVVKTSCRLTLSQDTHVPDLLTRIRILPSVAVVGQKERVIRPQTGRAILTVYVKYLPLAGESMYQSVKSLTRKIKSLPGVEIVSVLTIDGRQVLHKGEKIVT
jgi:hypothetical protein